MLSPFQESQNSNLGMMIHKELYRVMQSHAKSFDIIGIMSKTESYIVVDVTVVVVVVDPRNLPLKLGQN